RPAKTGAATGRAKPKSAIRTNGWKERWNTRVAGGCIGRSGSRPSVASRSPHAGVWAAASTNRSNRPRGATSRRRPEQRARQGSQNVIGGGAEREGRCRAGQYSPRRDQLGEE